MANEWYVKGLRNIVQETIKESRLPHDTQNPVLLRKLERLLAAGQAMHDSNGMVGKEGWDAAKKAFLEGSDGK